jgi:hypothetical protein
VLSATGPDFGLMQEFIPNRTRAELKKKFLKEEKIDLERVNETLLKPSMLDDTLYTRVEKLNELIEKELREKEAAKSKKGKLRPLIMNALAENAAQEAAADVMAQETGQKKRRKKNTKPIDDPETEDIGKKKPERATRKKAVPKTISPAEETKIATLPTRRSKRQKAAIATEPVAGTSGDLGVVEENSYATIISQLKDFPAFRIEVDPSIASTSLERTGTTAIVRIAPNTQVNVIDATAVTPQRLLLQTPVEKANGTGCFVQDQSHDGSTSSGCLYLFGF